MEANDYIYNNSTHQKSNLHERFVRGISTMYTYFTKSDLAHLAIQNKSGSYHVHSAETVGLSVDSVTTQAGWVFITAR